MVFLQASQRYTPEALLSARHLSGRALSPLLSRPSSEHISLFVISLPIPLPWNHLLLRLLKPKAKAESVLQNRFFPIGYILQRAWLWKRKGDEAGGNKNINIFKKSRTPKKNLRTALSRVSSLPSTHRRWQFLSPTIAGIFYLRSAVAVSSWGQRKCLQVQICICREFHDWLYYRGEVGWG